jgi:hypothetical protein
MQTVQIYALSELNLRPLQELLNSEIDINELIQHLDKTYRYFSQYCMKVSCSDGTSVEEQEIICLYWIERLKILFENMKP